MEVRQLLTAAPLITGLERLPSAVQEFDFRITGSAEPDSLVTLQQSGIGVIQQVYADSAGQWVAEAQNVSLSDSRFEFSAIATDLGGNISGPSNFKVFQPNIILVNVDDMRADELQYLPFVSTQLASESTVFTNMFAPTALCGPSRATLMTGLFAERTGVFGNEAPLGGSANLDLSSSLPVWLNNGGYQTGLFGKDRTTPGADQLMPSQSNMPNPPGWDEYFALRDGSDGFTYTVDHNGLQETYGTGEADYATDVIDRSVLQFAHAATTDNVPFFAYVAPIAPHSPSTPAPRHFGFYSNVTIEHPPSYNIPGDGGTPLSSERLAVLDDLARRKYESLLAVDECVSNLVTELQNSGDIDNTIIIFTSDNGFIQGEHARSGKLRFYDEAIRLPLVIWDGRNPVPSASDSIVLNADLGPTVASLAGVTFPIDLDGKDLAPILQTPSTEVRGDFLIHHWMSGQRSNYSVEELGVRNRDWVFAARSDGTNFLFNIIDDPYQLNNLANVPAFADVRQAMELRLDELRPIDQVAPSADNVEVHVSPALANGKRRIRISAVVSDVNSGDSQIRTPELFFEPNAPIGIGLPLDSLDGDFDSATETTYLDLEWRDYIAAGSPSTVYLRFRDLPGNWSLPVAVPIQLGSAPILESGSDTGDSSMDWITLDNSPTFIGSAAEPDATVTLFATPGGSGAAFSVLLGSAVVDQFGDWNITTIFSAAGVYAISGCVTSGINSNAPGTTLLAPVVFHLVAILGSDGVLHVEGTDSADDIEVRGNLGQTVQVLLGQTSAGTMSGVQRSIINGGNGNDSLVVAGNIPTILIGGIGNDTLFGGGGNDTLTGGGGKNQLSGGAGDDRYLFRDLGQGLLDTAISIIDTVDEELSGGIDTLAFDTPYGIVADLSPRTTTPLVVMKSPFRVKRTVKFAQSGTAEFIENIEGTNAVDQVVTGPDVSFKGGGGNDHDVLPLLPGQTRPLQQLSSGLATAATAEISASIQTTVGSVALNLALPTGVVFSQSSSETATLTGQLTSVNSFLLSGGLKLTVPTDFTGTIQVTLNSVAVAENSLTEQDELQLDVSWRPVLTTEGTLTLSDIQSPVILSPMATAADQDGNFTGGLLTVFSKAIVDSGDQLLILPQASEAPHITLQNDAILYEGIVVGSWTYDHTIQRLAISLNSNATLAAITAVVRRIAFVNVSSNSFGNDRHICFQLVDGAGVASAVSTTVVSDNRAPTAVALENLVPALIENVNTASRIRVADINVTDDAKGVNVLTLAGANAAYFEIIGNQLFLKARSYLNAQTTPFLSIEIQVTDVSLGSVPSASISGQLALATSVPTILSPSTLTSALRPATTWTAIPGAVSYDLYFRNLSANITLFHQITVSDTSYTPTFDFGIGRFTVWVRSVNAEGRKSTWSAPLTFVINAPVTINPVVLRQLTPRPTISWQALAGANHYDVWVDNISTGTSQIYRNSNLSGTSWTPVADLPIGRFRIFVRGVDAGGQARAWSTGTQFVVVPPPSIVSPLNATFDRTPTFEWSDVTGATHYEIIVKNGTTGVVEIQSLITTNSFTPALSMNDGLYRWQVRAIGIQNYSSNFTNPQPLNIGGRPTAFGPIGSLNISPIFSWSRVDGAATYELRVDRIDQPIFRVLNISGLLTNDFLPPAALIPGTYRYWIRAVSTSGEVSSWSLQTTFEVIALDAARRPTQLPDTSRSLENSGLHSIAWAPGNFFTPLKGNGGEVNLRKNEDQQKTSSNAAVKQEVRDVPGRFTAVSVTEIAYKAHPAEDQVRDAKISAIDYLMMHFSTCLE